MFIEDGRGSSIKAAVNPRHMLRTVAMNVSYAALNTLDHGTSWTFPFVDITPAGADDYFLYIRNENITDHIIARVNISSTEPGFVQVHVVSGTASGGTAVTPVQRNTGSTNDPELDVQSGTDITGLTNDGILDILPLTQGRSGGQAIAVAGLNYSFDPIVLARDSAIALLWTETSGTITGTVSIVRRELSLVETVDDDRLTRSLITDP